MSDAPERHDHWSVRVETSGEMIVQIETECLAGREPSAADEEAIRTAAHHLLAFIGDPHPVRADTCLHGEALEEVRRALIDAIELAHGISFSESPTMANWGVRVHAVAHAALARIPEGRG
ncbi:hypothetical protein [Pseudogemmobacter sonorensis]|uniref:hypothetical protein n=1 Tax=Pseudogemmobacter sonorensis TaxID=2989681 RepID=UPI0036850638